MARLPFVVTALALTLLGCGATRDDSRAGPGLVDAGEPDARDESVAADSNIQPAPDGGCSGAGGLDRVAASRDVKTASAEAQTQGGSACAGWLPASPTADVAAARGAVQSFVADLFGVSLADVTRGELRCGVDAIDCPDAFAHALFKADGRLGTSLLPIARRLDAASCGVEVSSWSAQRAGETIGLVITISGQSEGALAGIYWVDKRVTCP